MRPFLFYLSIHFPCLEQQQKVWRSLPHGLLDGSAFAISPRSALIFPFLDCWRVFVPSGFRVAVASLPCLLLRTCLQLLLNDIPSNDLMDREPHQPIELEANNRDHLLISPPSCTLESSLIPTKSKPGGVQFFQSSSTTLPTFSVFCLSPNFPCSIHGEGSGTKNAARLGLPLF